MYKGFRGITIDRTSIRIGYQMIFMNPVDSQVLKGLCEKLDQPVRVHFFYANPKHADNVTEIVKDLDEQISKNEEYAEHYRKKPLRIYLHHDKENRDMGIMLRCLIPDTTYVSCRVIPESKPVKFRIPGKPDGISGPPWTLHKSVQELCISMSGHNVSAIRDVRIQNCIYEAGFIGSLGDVNAGAITSEEQRMHPEFFRVGIIQRFKDNTPADILKSFQDDNDIWNYITCQGEWKVEK